MVSLDLPLTDLTDSFETLAHLPGWRVSLVAPAGMLAAQSRPGSRPLKWTLDGYIQLSGRSDLAGAADAAREHRAKPDNSVHGTTCRARSATPWSNRSATAAGPLLVAQSYELIIARLNRGADCCWPRSAALLALCPCW